MPERCICRIFFSGPSVLRVPTAQPGRCDDEIALGKAQLGACRKGRGLKALLEAVEVGAPAGPADEVELFANETGILFHSLLPLAAMLLALRLASRTTNSYSQ